MEPTVEKSEISSPPEADAPVWHMAQVESKSGFTALSNAACVGAAAAALAGTLDFTAGAADFTACFAGGLVVDSAATSSPTVAAVSTNIPSLTRILFL